ncbi:hypothetical protein EIN_012210 [Entamoeba invadens IP1]|uniref:Ras-GEF domain-containing protein n=1 Tax=Entamoeba invadens IP1 TaxID=370355 RepID=L7FK69_ENTIV|nr:hypothetical protein EIN_012210 [Entamoeba invadens IP1]ELP85734.1 hypothetical protein EIN_012210 [Entamoeba invadens IP1]|eukprot:XP_004185080.1 hypothetical protein EIN_012210 [Entamoeba invadens IP1]
MPIDTLFKLFSDGSFDTQKKYFIETVVQNRDLVFDPEGSIDPKFSKETFHIVSVPPDIAFESIFFQILSKDSLVQFLVVFSQTYTYDYFLSKLESKYNMFNVSTDVSNYEKKRLKEVAELYFEFYGTLMPLDIRQKLDDFIKRATELKTRVVQFVNQTTLFEGLHVSAKSKQQLQSTKRSTPRSRTPRHSNSLERQDDSIKKLQESVVDIKNREKSSLSKNRTQSLLQITNTKVSLADKKALVTTPKGFLSVDEIVKKVTAKIDINSLLKETVDYNEKTQKPLSIIEISPRLLAEQLYVTDLYLIKKVSIGDFLSESALSKKYSQDLNSIISAFGKTVGVATNKTEIFEFFISVACECLEISEYNFGYLIYCEFTSLSIKMEYAEAFEHVGKAIKEKYNKLNNIFSISKKNTYFEHFDKVTTNKFPITSYLTAAVVASNVTKMKDFSGEDYNHNFVSRMNIPGNVMVALYNVLKSTIKYTPHKLIQKYLAMCLNGFESV